MLPEFKLFLLFWVSSTLIIISPGPDFIYVTTRGIAQGKKAGLLSALGISFGLIVHTLLAAFGLSALLSTSGLAFSIVKYLGAGYLFYLGISAIFKRNYIQFKTASSTQNHNSIFRQAVFTNVFNPKAIITFMAFIPQFINPKGHTCFQIILLGSILAFLAAVWFGFVGYCAGTFGFWLSTKHQVQKFIKWISSLVLVSLGVRLLYSKR